MTRTRRQMEWCIFKRTTLILILALISELPPALAQTTNAPGDSASNNFYKGGQEAGFALGAGFSAHRIGDTSPHSLALSKLYYGLMLTGVKGKDRWYQGNWEVVEDVFGGGQFYPATSYMIGETTVLRYNFITGTRWVPFLDAGAGVLATDIGAPDLGTKFEFNEQVGPGVHFLWRRNTVLTFQYRYMHISNAGIKEPNQGINENMFYAGVGWYF